MYEVTPAHYTAAWEAPPITALLSASTPESLIASRSSESTRTRVGTDPPTLRQRVNGGELEPVVHDEAEEADCREMETHLRDIIYSLVYRYRLEFAPAQETCLDEAARSKCETEIREAKNSAFLAFKDTKLDLRALLRPICGWKTEATGSDKAALYTPPGSKRGVEARHRWNAAFLFWCYLELAQEGDGCDWGWDGSWFVDFI